MNGPQIGEFLGFKVNFLFKNCLIIYKKNYFQLITLDGQTNFTKVMYFLKLCPILVGPTLLKLIKYSNFLETR